jgi:CheY-like chemotaxis protein
MSQTPTVYFIDDSATMREVIKIAFRRENMNVVACHSGTVALSQMHDVPPDVVISDVIMPEKDGYEVCQNIKSDPRFSSTPVVLMSGVVNRAVAEKAFAVKADELIRKPFQPQDLITRVKHLLTPKAKAAQPVAQAPTPAPAAAAALSSIFATPITGIPMQPRTASVATLPPPSSRPVPPRFAPIAAQSPGAGAPAARPLPRPTAVETSSARPPVEEASSIAPVATPVPPPRTAAASGSGMDLQKIKLELTRLQGLVRKLQSELQAEREYSRALEEHIKTLQEAD